MAVTNTRGCHW